MTKLKYKRILLKLSGEAMMGDHQFGFDHDSIESLSHDIKEAKNLGAEICIVVGGGNLCRGATLTKIGIERVSADYIGMLATVMNAIALQSVLEKMGVQTRVQSAIAMTAVCEPYIRRRAMRHMEKGRVVIFAAGTGYPYVTTDTSSTLRALEMNCDVIVKGTQVDGVYSEDPKKNPAAIKFDKIDYKDVLTMNLQVMDSAAIGLARDNKVPILIFDVHSKGELAKVVKGTANCTVVE